MWYHRAEPLCGFFMLPQFTNPDYAHPKKYLRQDAQTEITPFIQEIAQTIGDEKSVQTLADICAAIHRLAPYKRPPKAPLFVTAADEIFKRGYATGCTNYAITFATLARAKDIPAIVVDSAHMDWVENGASLEFVSGHFFCEVFLKNKWRLIDPTSCVYYPDYNPDNPCLPGRYYAFAKGLSVIDVGIPNDAAHNPAQQSAFLNRKIDYQDPKYDVFDLRVLFKAVPQESPSRPAEVGSIGNSVSERRHRP